MRVCLTLLWISASLVWTQAPAAVAVPQDEPPVVCEAPALPVKEALSWARLWPELGLDRVIGAHGTLPQTDVPGVVRAVADKYKSLHATDLDKAESRRFLLVLEAVAAGVMPLNKVDWKVDPNADPEYTFIFPADRNNQIRIACLPSPKPAEYQADIARLIPVLKKITDFHIETRLEWLDFAVSTRERQTSNLLKNGLTMTPWEMKLNEHFLSPDDAKAGLRQQWILARPSGGAEINTRSRQKADLNGSLAIEPIGFIRYLDTDTYDSWIGGSLLITSSTNGGLGYGALVRYGNYTAGVTLHKAESGGRDDLYLFLGLDLYNLLDSKRPQLEKFVSRLKKR